MDRRAKEQQQGSHEHGAGSQASVDAILAVARGLRVCQIQMVAVLNAVLRHSDITIMQFLVLSSLKDRPLCQATPSELARENGETASNMTRICNTLVAKDWAKRVRSSADRREVNVSLTDAGIHAVEELAVRACSRGLCLPTTIDIKEVAEISQALVRLEVVLTQDSAKLVATG
ncbi:MarR family transcriptional regulator [Paucibacter sp. R3-3]|uniref:MarR family transcriptional regulator n=1 Tax=Roseateles agri TaxID=3098619 RepID=A0ABU5DSE1_9BURK|nr:MarR family transcriptional regulator [Paucibacter sp. R3-3]MDY0749064.1 MarR family transcriptional regulator [Paucibacter sp. R3-3]